MLKVGGISDAQAMTVEFAAADLLKDDGWIEACKDCTYVHHIASPFPLQTPKNEDDVIIPAREGTLRALRAAKAAGTVKRVIVTSSVAAIMYGHAQRSEPFTEKDWTVIDDPAYKVSPYAKSKTIAERAAWDWQAKDGGSMELSVVNPGGVFGPLLAKDSSTSIEIVSRLLDGSMPGVPRISFGVVDVRDVVDLHMRCMTDPKAAGERFAAVATNGTLSLKQMATILKEKLPPAKSRKVPTRVVPDWLLKLVAYVDSGAAVAVGELGKVRDMNNEKAISVLGWKPKSAEESLLATAESLDKFRGN